MSADAGQILYRIIQSAEPAGADFYSAMALRRSPNRIHRQQPELWTGLSMYDNEFAARDTALTYPQLGRWLAILRIEDLARTRMVIVKQTGAKGNHFTLWGLPEFFLAAIVTTAAV